MKRVKVRQLILNLFVWLATEIILGLLGLDDMADYGEYLNQQHFLIASEAQKQRKRDRIVVCCQSRCRKFSSGTVYRALQMALRQGRLQDWVEIKLTDCLNLCQSAPSKLIVPDRFKYTDIVRSSPTPLPTAIERHFAREASLAQL